MSFPSRPANAPTGSEFMNSLIGLKGLEREQKVYNEISRGNFPDFLRKLVPITTTKKDLSITYYVMPDYLSVGSNTDFVRIPLSPLTAQAIANQFGLVLPTKKMVDQIWSNATIKLDPKPLSSGGTINGKQYSGKEVISHKMMDTDSFIAHDKSIKDQLNYTGGGLVAGHKKDVIMPLGNGKSKVSIYGWHGKSGKPIQPASSPHENTYSDYSHGIRFISAIASIKYKDTTKKIPILKIINNEDLSSYFTEMDNKELKSLITDRPTSTTYKDDSNYKLVTNQPIPPGFVRAKKVPPFIQSEAQKIINSGKYKLGDKIPLSFEDNEYLAVLEIHNRSHQQAVKRRKKLNSTSVTVHEGPHLGVSIYEKINDNKDKTKDELKDKSRDDNKTKVINKSEEISLSPTEKKPVHKITEEKIIEAFNSDIQLANDQDEINILDIQNNDLVLASQDLEMISRSQKRKSYLLKIAFERFFSS